MPTGSSEISSSRPNLLNHLHLLLGVIAVHPPAAGHHVAVEHMRIGVVLGVRPADIVADLDLQLLA